MATKAAVVPTIFTAIDKLSAPVRAMTNSVVMFANRSEEAIARSNRKYRAMSESAFNMSKNAAIAGAAIIAPLVLAGKEAVKFEDKMADVAKTSGLAGVELAQFGQDLLKLAPKTRTSVEELQKIAEIGGQMGITGRNNLLAFTDSVNKFSVALGGDFQGGVEEATKSIAGLKNLFAETRGLDISEAITKSGSAINALSAKGVNVPELTEFISRIGQLPDAIKPSIQATAALGSVLNKAGITAEIGARGLGDVLLTASQNLPAFAKQMKLTTTATQQLLNSKPEQFLVDFAASLKGLKTSDIGPLLKSLKLGDVGSIKVIGALGTATEQLAEFQEIANTEFAAGTSLLNEYNTKNNTTAAQIEKLKNTATVLAVNIGNALLPVINSLVASLAPLIDKVTSWISRNPELTSTIVKIVAAAGALAIAIAGISFAIGVYSKAMLIANSISSAWLLIKNSELLVTARVALAYIRLGVLSAWATIKTAAWSAAQTVLNFILSANPIGLVVIAIAALIAAVVWITQKTTGWSETWDSAMKFMNAAIDFFVASVKIYFLGIEHAFLTMVDGIVSAWKWAQNAIGLLSDEQYAKDKANIQKESATRIAAIKSQVGIAQTAAGEMSKGIDFQVKMKPSDGEEAAPAMSQKQAEQESFMEKFQGGFKSSVDINLNNPRLAGASSSPNVNVNTSKSSGGW